MTYNKAPKFRGQIVWTPADGWSDDIDQHEHERPCWVCGAHDHCGCICGIREDGTYGPS